MADGNKFKETVESLFQGMDSVVSSKTVVGDAIHINGTIILPLVDVSFGIGAGSFNAEKERQSRRWNRWKDHTECCDRYSGWKDETCEYQESGYNYKTFGYGT